MEAHSFARSDGGLALPRSRKLLSAFGDERLVTQLRRGNGAAFEVLYDRHHAAVLSYCRHMLGSRDEAEDALQQAFISAHADIVSSDKPIRFKAWIYTIARNRCLSILRARREQPSEDLDRISTDGLGDEVQQRADLQELLTDMRELPDDQRTALILSELGDLSHAEVAEVIECEASKVKSLVFQARSGLMERRQARETPCHEIREQLATLRGGSLRRGPLRRHLSACPGCAEFRDEVRRQRQLVAAVLPVVPTLALRENALAAVGISASSASSGVLAGGGAGAVFAAKAGVVKVAVIAVATSGAVGGAVAVERTVDNGDPRGGAGQGAEGAGGHGAGGKATPGPDNLAEAVQMNAARALVPPSGSAQGTKADENAPGTLVENLFGDDDGGASEGKRGFEPVQGGSNGERAREFARGRGQGQHRGLDKPHRGIEKQTARDGSNGKALGREPKPAKENAGPRRPETAGPRNEAKPAPKPKPLAPLLAPLNPNADKGPPLKEEKPPRVPNENRPDPSAEQPPPVEQP